MDLRKLPLHLRKTNLARLLARVTAREITRVTSGCIRTRRGEGARPDLGKYDNEQARAQHHKAGYD
jgi:hypothetical protein